MDINQIINTIVGNAQQSAFMLQQAFNQLISETEKLRAELESYKNAKKDVG
jgi:hypothetical protein